MNCINITNILYKSRDTLTDSKQCKTKHKTTASTAKNGSKRARINTVFYLLKYTAMPGRWTSVILSSICIQCRNSRRSRQRGKERDGERNVGPTINFTRHLKKGYSTASWCFAWHVTRRELFMSRRDCPELYSRIKRKRKEKKKETFQCVHRRFAAGSFTNSISKPYAERVSKKKRIRRKKVGELLVD